MSRLQKNPTVLNGVIIIVIVPKMQKKQRMFCLIIHVYTFVSEPEKEEQKETF